MSAADLPVSFHHSSLPRWRTGRRRVHLIGLIAVRGLLELDASGLSAIITLIRRRRILVLWWRSVCGRRSPVALKPRSVLRVLVGAAELSAVVHPASAVHGLHASLAPATGADASEDDQDGNDDENDDAGQDPATPVVPGTLWIAKASSEVISIGAIVLAETDTS